MAKIGYQENAPSLSAITADGKPYLLENGFKYAILEKVDIIKFSLYEIINDYPDWDNGRIFGINTELKWKKRNGKYHIVVTTEDDLPIGFSLFSDTLEPIRDEKGNIKYRRIFLWGEQEKDNSGQPTGRWFEERIPQLLKYPIITDKSRVQLKVQEYEFTEELKASVNGQAEKTKSIIYRFIDLEEV